jgi:cytochrome c-type biogenesis protein CcmF
MDISYLKLGQLAVSLALILSIYAFIVATVAERTRNLSALISARNAMGIHTALVLFGVLVLFRAFITNDFSAAYVAQNSNLNLPMLYKVSALWSAHEGSLLLWALYLAVFSFSAICVHWRNFPLSMPLIIATFSAVQIGFLIFIIFLSNPFLTLTPTPLNGQDLNPLLQDPGLAFHPPVLYLGYVGFTVPFAFAIAALIRGYSGIEWVVAVRRWVLFSWAALTSGIIFGGYWAYYELGWGGYWAWDPVENASLMPWLTATALVHSMMVQEKRHMFRTWNVFLVTTTFLLTLLGTFLVRSGVLTSVHSFAVDPGRGTYMLIFLAVAMVVSYGLIIWRSQLLESEAIVEKLISRESGILINSILLLLTATCVFIGTIYPLFLEVVSDQKVSVGAPYYNIVVLPVMVALMFLMALGPSIPWRGMTLKRLWRISYKQLIFGSILAIACMFLPAARTITVLATFAVGFAAACIVRDISIAVSTRKRLKSISLWLSIYETLTNSRRRMGSLIVHFGIVLIAAGMIGSGLFQSTKTVFLNIGQSTEISDFTVTLRNLADTDGENFQGRVAEFSVSQNGNLLFVMQPQKRFYKIRNMTTTEIAIHSFFSGDLYMVMGNESESGGITARIFWNPLIIWIWLGWMIVLAGSMLSLTQSVAFRKPNVHLPKSVEVPAE